MRVKNYSPRMKTSLWLPASSALMLILSGCANNNSSSPTGTGPYDSAGNYHEEWADDPSKWRKPGNSIASNDELPLISKNEQPPPNANPLAAQSAMPKLPPAHVESKNVTSKHRVVDSSDEPKHHTSTAKAASTKHKHPVSKEEPEEHHSSASKGTATKHHTTADKEAPSKHHGTADKETSSTHKHTSSDDKSDKKTTSSKRKHTSDSSDEPKHTTSKPKAKSSASD